MSPRTEALAFRIWAYCREREWYQSVPAVAEALGVSAYRVRRVIELKGWQDRFIRTRRVDPESVLPFAGIEDGRHRLDAELESLGSM